MNKTLVAIASGLSTTLGGCISSKDSFSLAPPRERIAAYATSKHEGYWTQAAQYKSGKLMVEVWDHDSRLNEIARIRAVDFDGDGPETFTIAPAPWTHVPENHPLRKYYDSSAASALYQTIMSKKKP